MSESYVDAKVREALIASKGSRAMAQKLLIAWAAKDERLLQGMAQPFMKAIAGAAVEGALRRHGGRSRPAPARTDAVGSLSRDALQAVLSRLGEEEDGAAAPRPTASPIQSATTVIARSDARPGIGHETAMLALAKAFAAKKVR